MKERTNKASITKRDINKRADAHWKRHDIKEVEPFKQSCIYPGCKSSFLTKDKTEKFCKACRAKRAEHYE